MDSHRIRVSPLGELVLPPDLRERLHVEGGGELTVYERDGRIVIDNIDERVRRVRDIVRKYVPEGTSAVDELIAERRAEAERE